VWIFHASNQLDRVDRLTQQGARLIDCANGRGEVDLIRMLALLAQEGINEVLVEAGARLNGALLNADCADELLLYLAPSVLGGEARGLFDSPVLSDLSNRKSLVFKDVRRVGSDLRILARFQPSGSTDSG
jgi:diaminohydroxyphosphoribosylaminopyrimidine deaminase/5-amino-6-(5-phosphoribosylamino)uracil reductase